jgi:hypothetical protein
METGQVDVPPDTVDGFGFAPDCCATHVFIAPGMLRKAWRRPLDPAR